MFAMLASAGVLGALLVAPQQPEKDVSVTLHEDIQYSEVARQGRRNRLDLFVPKTAQPPPLVMFVHGGTWTGGRKEKFVRIGMTLAENGYACAVINTQLFPFAKPDEMVADCGRALGFLYRHAQEYGFDGEQLFVMGHSSGAHLAGWLALDDRQIKFAGVPRKALRGAILLSGVYDVRSRHIALDGVFGQDLEFRKNASPLLYAGRGDPPVLMAWGQYDMPGLSLCARMLRDRLQAANVPVVARELQGRNHVDYLWSIGRADDCVTADVLRFLANPMGANPMGANPMAANRSEASPALGDSSKPAVAPSKVLRRTIMWVATCAREHAVGMSMRKAMRPHGVEVLVYNLVNATGASVALAFRGLRTERLRQQARVPSHVAGIGMGGLAAATAPLTGKHDGLLGRIVAATPLGRSLSAFRRRVGDAELGCLQQVAWLSLFGDQDPSADRLETHHRSVSLLRAGHEAHLIELANTTAEAALLALHADDDLVVPLLMAFLFP